MVVTPFLAWVPWKREENPFCVNALLGVHLQARRCRGKRVVSQRKQRCKANQFCDKLTSFVIRRLPSLTGSLQRGHMDLLPLRTSL